MKSLLALAMFAILAGAAAPVSAQTPPPSPAADVAGSWDVNFNTGQGAIPASLKLKKDGATLAGTLASQMGETTVEAEVKGKDVSVWFNFQGQNGPMAVEMLGKVDGDKMSGTFSAGGQSAGDWAATRTRDTKDTPDTKDTKAPAPAAAPAKVDLTGDWNLSVELPDMTATPTLTIKQDGEKLTGDYVSTQYGKFPLKGTVKGSEVTFSFTMTVEGNGLDVTYTGTVDKDGGMAGSVNYGEMMSGRFSGTKKK